jgi:uncharacterized membrane protein (UPF0127 family)
MKIRYVTLSVCFLCIFLSCVRSPSKKQTLERVVLSVNGRQLNAEIARTREQRLQGLMYRGRLEWSEGMLFIFRKSQYLSFWMKDTVIPLDIAYLDKNGKVTDIFHMEPYSLVPVRSREKVRYALEVNQGFFRDAGLAVGDRIDLSDVPRRLF